MLCFVNVFLYFVYIIVFFSVLPFGVINDNNNNNNNNNRGITYAVNAHIEVVIFHSVSECQSDKYGEFAIFSQNWLPWQRPLRYRKKRSRSIICTQNTLIQ